MIRYPLYQYHINIIFKNVNLNDIMKEIIVKIDIDNGDSYTLEVPQNTTIDSFLWWIG
jgi:hypothetical protein